MCKAIQTNTNVVAIQIHTSELDSFRRICSEFILQNHSEVDVETRKSVTLAGKVLAATEEIAEAIAG